MDPATLAGIILVAGVVVLIGVGAPIAIAIGLPAVGFDVKGVRDLPAVQLAPEDDIARLADCVLSAARGQGPALPAAETLSYVHAADTLLEFAQFVRAGRFPRGRIYAA